MSYMFDELAKDFDPTKLTREQAETFNAFNQKADPEFMEELERANKLYTGDGINGTYRIEVTYEHRRSGVKRSVALITVYRSNKERDLNMDVPLFLCSSEQGEGCGAVLTGDELIATLESGEVTKVLYCTNCKKYINRYLSCNSFFMNNEPKVIAERVYKLFRELNSDADIVLTYHKADIKAATEDYKGSSLRKVKEKREKALYPLKNIIKDAGDSGLIIRKITDFLSV